MLCVCPKDLNATASMTPDERNTKKNMMRCTSLSFFIDLSTAGSKGTFLFDCNCDVALAERGVGPLKDDRGEELGEELGVLWCP